MIAFFARNGVAANLLMFAIIIAGGAVLWQRSIPLEVFPEFPSNFININVPYRGATPEEVEESIVIRVEEAVADVEGIETIFSTASETATLTVTAQNDDPVLGNNTGLTLNEGATAGIGTALLEVTDIDNTPAELTYTVTAGLANGQLELTTTPGTAIARFA